MTETVERLARDEEARRRTTGGNSFMLLMVRSKWCMAEHRIDLISPTERVLVCPIFHFQIQLHNIWQLADGTRIWKSTIEKYVSWLLGINTPFMSNDQYENIWTNPMAVAASSNVQLTGSTAKKKKNSAPEWTERADKKKNTDIYLSRTVAITDRR